MRRSSVLSLPFQLVFPALAHTAATAKGGKADFFGAEIFSHKKLTKCQIAK